MKEGKGKLTYKNGTIYEGTWKGDKRDGEGVFKNAILNVEYKKEINNNKEKKNEESKLNNNIILNLDDIKIPKKPRKPKRLMVL